MSKSFAQKVLIGLGIWCSFTMESFAGSVNKANIKIVLEESILPKDPKENAQIKKAWPNACKVFGESFLVRRNYFGHGIAENYECFLGKQRLNGTSKIGKPDWTVQITAEGEGWLMQVFYKDKPKPETLTPIPKTPKMIEAMIDPKVSRLLALQVMDSLPMARVVSPQELSTGITYTPEQGFDRKDIPAPIKEYNVYTLKFIDSQKVWAPKIIGKATLESSSDGSNKWKMDLVAAPNDTVIYWAQSSNGRGSEARNINSKLNSVLIRHGVDASIFDKGIQALYDTLASGYVGARFGYPITKGDSIISRSMMVGILAEIRGGPFEGLRWYWDFAPEIKEKASNGETLSFTWSRPSIGWSFGLNIPWFIKRIDVTPKLGVLDLDAKVPIDTGNGSTVPGTFRMKNSTNLGLELGIEAPYPWFLVRLWGASDVSGIVDVGGSGTMTSLRGGLDTYWNFYKISRYFDLSVLVFAFGERLSLTQDEKDKKVVSGTNLKIEGVSYNLAFFGLGAVLTW